jgi:CrcB protein
MTVLLVALGAAVGAPARYLADRTVQRRFSPALPWGTIVINVVASFVLGILTGSHHLSTSVAALLGTGFCGTLSTYSTFAFETHRLAEDGRRDLAVVNLVVTLVAGIGAAILGFAISH